MSYTPDGVTEKVGSAAGLDARRVRGDLERFRDLIENRKVASGAWRGARPQIALAVRRAHEMAATGTSSIPMVAIAIVAQ